MKRLHFFLFASLCFTVSGYSQSSMPIVNSSNCRVEVIARCYDLCINGISNASGIIGASSSGSVQNCNLGSSGDVSTIYEVCLDDQTKCTPPDCIYVLGPGNGNTCGLTMGITLSNCPECGNPAGTSVSVTFTGTQIVIN